MRILVLDSALARCGAAMVVDDEVVTSRSEDRRQGHELVLPVMARDVLRDARRRDAAPPAAVRDARLQDTGGHGRTEDDRAVDDPAGASLDCVAVVVGPGSFTGIRAGVALAQGIALALGVPAIGVTVGEAIGDAFPRLGDRELWTVTPSRRDHIFLERAAGAVSLALEALPTPVAKVAIAGGAALAVAARLAARGANVMLTDARYPLPRHVARIAALRLAGALPPRAAQPLYVDPPEARIPAGGTRPPPDDAGR